MKQIAEDFLRGTGCAACAVLFTAVSFFSGDVLTAFIAAAGTLYLCIFLMRSPDKAFIPRYIHGSIRRISANTAS